jgi:hypothetical protein
MDNRKATLEVSTDRQWFGDPRLGTFIVYLDGNRAGMVPPRGQLVLHPAPGRHVLRARQWWYLSPRLEIEVGAGTHVDVRVDVIREGTFPFRMLRMIFTPWRGLTLARTDE